MNFSSQSNDLVGKLAIQINKQRREQRKKLFKRHRLGDQAAQKLLMQGLDPSSYTLANLLEREFNLASLDSDFITFEMRINQISTNPLDNLTLVLTEMIQKQSRQKLVMSSGFTHVSIGFNQTGTNNNVFQIGVLLLQSHVSVDKIFERSTNLAHDSGCLIVGKVLDTSVKPVFVVINKEHQGQMCTVGPDRIFYDSLSGEEFKVILKSGEPACNALLTVPMPTIEVYTVPLTQKAFKLANEQGSKSIIANQQPDPRTFSANFQLSLTFTSFLVPQIDFKEMQSISLEEAFQTHGIMATLCPPVTAQNRGVVANPGAPPTGLINRLANGGARSQLTGNGVNDPEAASQPVRKTRTQLLREQQAKTAMQDNSMVSATSAYFQPQRTLNDTFAGQQVANGGQQRQFETATQNVQIQHSSYNQSLSHVSPHTNRATLNNTGAWQPKPQMPVFQPQQTSTQVKPNPFQFNPSQSSSQTQQLQGSNGSSVQGPFNFKPAQVFQSHTQSTMPAYQPATSGYSNQSQSTAQLTYAPQQVIQPSHKPFQPTFVPQQQQAQQQQQTPLPVRFTVAGTQSKKFDSKTSHNLPSVHSQQQLQGFVPFQSEQSAPTFSKLSVVDQDALKKCLKQLSQVTDAHDLALAEQQMIENPYRFYEMYTLATQSLEDDRMAQNSKRHQEVQKGESKPAEVKFPKITDFDDMTLFIIQLAENKYESAKLIFEKQSSTTKFSSTLKLLKETKLTADEALTQIILSREVPRNDSFLRLYREISQHGSTDMVFTVNGDKFKCHQIVFVSFSSYMKEAIHKNNQLNKQQFGHSSQYQSFDLPGWMDSRALKQFIRFAYTGSLKLESADKLKSRPEEALALYRLAGFFYQQSVQEAVVAEEIIPNMNSSSAIMFLFELLNPAHSPCKRKYAERPKAFLLDYCMFYLSKHLPVILRQDQSKILNLPPHVISELLRESFTYIVDAKADIEVLVKFASDIWADKDVFQFFKMTHARMKKCCGFDQQHIPQIRDIKHKDPNEAFKRSLIQGYDYTALNKIKRKVRDSMAAGSEDAGNEKEDKVLESGTCEESEGKPSCNVLVLADGQPDTSSIKKPVFTFDIDLTEPETSEMLEKETTGVSFFSKAFDHCRRSWNLKVDIDKSENTVSLWLIERGEPCGEQSAFDVIKKSMPVRFTSTLCEIEVVDSAINKSAFFFSFSHDSHQIIGHKNYVQLDQLQNKEKLTIRVNMREHVIHSSLMHYFASNFQARFKDECARLETLKLCPPHVVPGVGAGTNTPNGLLSLPTYVVFWLLQSDLLKVEDENTVLSFIFHFTKLQIKAQSLSKATQSANLLAKSIRFNYIDLYNVLSAIRKNESMQLSEVFVDSVSQENKERLKLGKLHVVKSLSDEGYPKPEDSLHFCGPARKYYDQNKALTLGRAKLETSDRGVHLTMFDEVIRWALNSKTEQIVAQIQPTTSSQYYQTYQHQQQEAQIRALNAQLLEERVRANKAADELRLMTNMYRQTTSTYDNNKQLPVYQPQPQPKLYGQQKENLPTKVQVSASSPINKSLAVNQSFEDALNNSFKLIDINKRDPKHVVPQQTLVQSKNPTVLAKNNAAQYQPQPRQVPGSLAPKSGDSINNTTADLTTILAAINRSPIAPQRRKVPGTLQRSNTRHSNKSSQECTIF